MMPSHAMMTPQSSHQSSDGNHDLTNEPLVLTSSHYSDGGDTSIDNPRSTIIQPTTTVPVDGLSAVAADDGYGFAATPPHSHTYTRALAIDNSPFPPFPTFTSHFPTVGVNPF